MGRVDISHDMTRFDAVRSAPVVEKAYALYRQLGSQNILDNWDDYLRKFQR